MEQPTPSVIATLTYLSFDEKKHSKAFVINWKLLKEQKLRLLELGPLMKDEELLDGLLGLVDGLQDAAVELGLPENEVFHLPEDEEEEAKEFFGEED